MFCVEAANTNFSLWFDPVHEPTIYYTRQCFIMEIKSTTQLQARDSFTLNLGYEFCSLVKTRLKCITAIKALFLYFNLCPSIMLDCLSCSFTSISFPNFSLWFDPVHEPTIYYTRDKHAIDYTTDVVIWTFEFNLQY
jgi:hypothetical protein